MSSKISSQPAAVLPSFGALFGEAWRVYRRHFVALMGFAGWLLLPLALHVLIRVAFGDSDRVDAALLVLSGMTVAIGVWSFCHITHFAAHVHATGKPPETLADVRGVLFSAFCAFLVYGLVVLVGLVAVIPGVLFAIWFAFAPAIAVLERRNVFVALGESRELVRGRFFRTLGRLWAMDALFVVAYVALVVVIDILLGYDLAHLDITAPLPVPMDIVLSAFEIAAAPLITVYRTVLYLGMKTR